LTWELSEEEKLMRRIFARAASSVVVLSILASTLFILGCESGGDEESTAARPIPSTGVAFVITTDFTTGSYSVVDLASRATFNDIGLGAVGSDVGVARAFGGRIYVVNRFGADNIQIIDPQQGYTTPAGAQLSVGPGSNPQDIAFIDATKAYVSRLASAELLIINPTALSEVGTVDLSSLVKSPEDGEGPEPARMLVYEGMLYVALQHFDPAFEPVAEGEIAVINPATDQVDAVIPLLHRNPFSALQFSPALNRILVSTVGGFRSFGHLDNDGGIEAIDPVTHTVDLVIDEATMGGDITHFEVVSATEGFAIVESGNTTSLVRFNPETGEVTTVAGPFGAFVPHFAINSRNELYLAVREPAASGLRIFDVGQDPVRELTDETLGVGLPPFFVLFLE
jgi:DNA-binding beta-propeller fold protein YncE